MSALKKRVVIYTRQFPKPNSPTDGLFTAQMVLELKEIADVTVVCPVPWCPNISFFKRWPDWFSNANIPKRYNFKGVDVYYVKFLVIPILARYIQPLFQVLSTLPLIAKLKRNRRVEVINTHNLYPDGVGGMIVGRMLGIPVVHTSLGSDINSNLSSKIRMSQIRWALSQSQCISAKSRALVELIKTLLSKEIPVSFIPNGVDSSKFKVLKVAEVKEVRASLDLSQTERYVLFVGRFDEVKGLEFMISALAKINEMNKLNFTTLLVGDGPLRDKLMLQVTELGLSNKVIFVGKVSHELVAKYQQATDFFCLSSLNEGMPNVVLEALACGNAVVATQVGGVPELVNNKNGKMVPARDSDALAYALVDVISRDWDANDIAETVAWANWKVSARQYLDMMESAIKQRESVSEKTH